LAGAKDAANAAYGGDPTAVLNACISCRFNDYSNVEWTKHEVQNQITIGLAAWKEQTI
jgi:hypothetical protein